MERLITQTSDNLSSVEYFQNPIPSVNINHENTLESQHNLTPIIDHNPIVYDNVVIESKIPPISSTNVMESLMVENACDDAIIIDPCDIVMSQQTNRDFLIIIGSMIIIGILFIIMSLVGLTNKWYRELNKGAINPWVVTLLWSLSILLSYVTLFLLWNNSSLLTFMVLFLISMFMSLGWVIIFYYGQDIGLSLWLISVLFIYKFWLFVHIWYIRPIASVFLIPILLMYIYLMYSVAHLAYLNGIML